jgi:hypothetical protein
VQPSRDRRSRDAAAPQQHDRRVPVLSTAEAAGRDYPSPLALISGPRLGLRSTKGDRPVKTKRISCHRQTPGRAVHASVPSFPRPANSTPISLPLPLPCATFSGNCPQPTTLPTHACIPTAAPPFPIPSATRPLDHTMWRACPPHSATARCESPSEDPWKRLLQLSPYTSPDSRTASSRGSGWLYRRVVSPAPVAV